MINIRFFIVKLVLTVMFMDSVLEYKPIEMPFGTMILWSYTMKLTYSTILGAPGTLLVAWLKDQEGLREAYEVNPLKKVTL